jgi:hypothetical protein
MRKTTHAAWVLSFFFLISPVLAYDSPQGLQIEEFQRFTLDDPFSGPVEAIANTDQETVNRGGLMDVFIAVQNHSNDATVGVVIDLDLRYADGIRVQPFNLGSERVQLLGPDEGIGFFIFWQIPPDAPLGTASFTVNAIVTRLTGGSEDHGGNENPMVASDSVTFDVVP